MSTIQFYNSGTLDLRAATTFGVNVKQDSSAIGLFGTGLKYGIAGVLRQGGNISLFTDNRCFHFMPLNQTIRGKEFQVIGMCETTGPNPTTYEPLGWTTDVGKTWKPWMLFREFYCNALDEGGSFRHNKDIIHDVTDLTVWEIETDIFDDVISNFGDYFLDFNANAPGNNEIECASLTGSPHGFYKSVNVGNPTHRQFRCTWNVLDQLDLTEDRTMKYSFQIKNKIRSFIAYDCDDRKLIERVLTATDQFIEHDLEWADLMDDEHPSPMFKEIAAKLYSDRSLELPNGLRKLVLSVARDMIEPEDIALTGAELKALIKAKEFAKELGYAPSSYQLRVVADLGSGVMGMAEKDTIFVTRAAIHRGQRELCLTVLEECIHLQDRLHDNSRGMQNKLFDLIAQVYSKHVEML